MFLSSIGLFFSIVFMSSLGVTASEAKPRENNINYEICPGLRLENLTSLVLNESEKNLLCGELGLDGWRTIPINQRKFFISRFLQQRGYHEPRYREMGSGLLLVIPGEKTIIKKIEVKGLPEKNPPQIQKRRFIRGEVLTPTKLDELSAWLKSELQNRGYGCPQIDIRAKTDGLVLVDVKPGPIHLVSDIERPESSAFHSEIFKRYEAFQSTEPLNNRLFTLSSQRILIDDYFLSAYYEFRCDRAQSLRIFQNVVQGKPRLITVGVGIDTEGLLKARIQWKHSRLDSNASNIQIELSGSFVEQSLETSMKWYPTDPGSRLHLIPKVKATRYSEDQFEAIAAETSLLAATTYDQTPIGLSASYGPAFEYTDTRKGLGPKNSRFLSFKGDLRFTSHTFEYFLSDPQSGWNLNFSSYSRFKQIYSSSTFHRFTADWTSLWNLGSFDPPYAVLGWRGSAGTFWIPNGEFVLNIPPQIRFFLGGDTDLRGFERKEIPADQKGVKTFVYQGFEIRSGKIFPVNLQPFIFFDMAWASYEPFQLSSTTYMSPGFGIRWPTKIGVFRGTAAHGFIRGHDPTTKNLHWQFFLSYGQEF